VGSKAVQEERMEEKRQKPMTKEEQKNDKHIKKFRVV